MTGFVGFVAVEVTLTDGRTREFGSRSGAPNLRRETFTFNPGESIRGTLIVGGTGARRSTSGVGYLRFETSEGRTFEAGRNDVYAFRINADRTLLSGVFGRASTERIHTLAFVFTRPILSARLVNVEYPTLANLAIPGRWRNVVSTTHATNDSGGRSQYTVHISAQRGSSQCWTSQTVTNFGIQTRVTAPFPGEN